jgi:hypothetical protein
MVYNGICDDISVISWRLVLLMEEIGIPGEYHPMPQVTGKLYHIQCCIDYTSPRAGFELTTSVMRDIDCTHLPYDHDYDDLKIKSTSWYLAI